MTFGHYILTRFNLPLSSRKSGESTNVCGQEYLSYRFDLFEQFCLPSVRNQVCQNFKWLILFDINTPDEFKKKAADWHNEYPKLIPCYLDVKDYGGMSVTSNYVTDVDTDTPMLQITSRFVADIIRSLEESLPEWILTTRLDSDDALHRDWIKCMQNLFKANPQQLAYDFVYTFKYIPSDGVAYRYALKNGHYITLAETFGSEIRSVLFCNHLEIDKNIEVKHIYGRTLQTELIHSGNVVNDYSNLSIGGLWYALLHFRERDYGYGTVLFSRRKALWMLGSLLKQRILQWVAR